MSKSTNSGIEPDLTKRSKRIEQPRVDMKDLGILGGLLAIVLYLSLSTTTFLTGQNIVNVLDQAVMVGLVGAGATLCIVSGVFDLSAGATLALSAISGCISQTYSTCWEVLLAHLLSVDFSVVLPGFSLLSLGSMHSSDLSRSVLSIEVLRLSLREG